MGKSKNSFFSYELKHLLVYPFFWSLIFGIQSKVLSGGSLIDYLYDNTILTTPNFKILYDIIDLIIVDGWAIFFISYYPIKIIILFKNRLINNKWEWGMGIDYYILPFLLFVFRIFFG